MTAPSLRERLAGLSGVAPRVVRKMWVGAVAFACGLVATTVLALATHRLYRSEAVVVYDRGIRSSSMGGDGESGRLVAARLRDMLTSRQRLEGLIKQMKLYPSIADKRGLGEAIDELNAHIKVGDREGYTYRISYDGEARDVAENLLTRILGDVIEEDRQRRVREAAETKKFLDAERRHADEDLKGKESVLSAFLTTHPQLAAEVGGGAATGGLIRAADRDRAGASGGETAALEMQAAQLESNLAAMGGSRPGRATPGGEIGDPSLLAARGRAQVELQTAQRDLAEKQTHLTNEHPDVKQAQRRLALAEAAERRAEAAAAAWKPPAASAEAPPSTEDSEEAGRAAALRRALAAVRQQISSLHGRSAPRSEVPKAVGSVVAIDTEWTRLNREVSEARERQSQLEARQFQAELAVTLTAGGQGGRFVIADPPFRPMRPITGGRLKIVLVGVAGSLLLAILVIGLFAALDDRLYASSDAEGILNDGIVVVIPSAPRRIAAKGG